MSINHRKLVALGLASFCLAAGAGAADFPIHDGDRVVFLGDSITEQKLYTTYIESYVLTRYPIWKLSFRNTGWGGDTAWLRQRFHPDEGKLFAATDADQQAMVEDSVKRGLERDVLPLRPTFVTIDFGMNDHEYQAFREDIFRAYVRSQTQLAKDLEAAGARVAFITPQPIEEKRPDPDQDVRNQSLRKFSDGLKEVAAKENALYADEFDPYMKIMMDARAANPAAFIGGGDSVHPKQPGHTLMAWAILKALGAPTDVSQAEIAVPAGTVTSSDHCTISNVKATDGGLSFDRLDEALPMPIDAKAEPALKLAPVLNDLSRYMIKVTGLTPGNYDIKIDGDSATQATDEKLAAGLNLSDLPGPLRNQGRKILDLVIKKNDLFFHRWREVQLYNLPKWAQNSASDEGRAAEVATEDKQIAELESQIDEARKPALHHFEIKRAN
ncbi:MAG TPA: SGNH/GDSL hydrolase family protein [Verrucomicrobiae bacterium]|jgi:lysophospholipase L1-like esterase